MKKYIYFISQVFLLLNFFLVTASAQVVVELSKEKVIISGTVYYLHAVKKGETPYSISRAYGITVEELTKDNPQALYGTKEGEVLRVQFRESQSQQSSAPPVQKKRDDSKFIYHVIKGGDTVYSLSRLYGVSEEEIRSSNAGIEITRLPVGYEIAIPRRNLMTEKQQFTIPQANYIFHKVERGESLSSIAQKYDLPLRELRRENRELRFPQVGDFVRIPLKEGTQVQTAQPVIFDTISAVMDTIPEEIVERTVGYTMVNNLRGKVDVAVLLPFYLHENSVRYDIDSSRFVKGKRQMRIVPKSEDWIYSRSTGFLEMYQGILIAADSLTSLGLEVNLHVYDIKSDTVELTRIIRQDKLKDMDLIIGPVYSANLSIMADYAEKNRIPVVSPVRLMSNNFLEGNPDLFMANPTISVVQDAIAKEVGNFSNSNIVFIHNDSAGVDTDVIHFREKIIYELSNHLPFPEVRFKELNFYSRSAFGNDSINRLAHSLNPKSDNIVIIASEDDPVISETLQELHTLSKRYPLKVFGYPAVMTLDNLEPKFIFELDMLLFSPTWIDYSKNNVKKFNAKFRKLFLTEPAEMSYAWLGYDIAFYFISGLSIHGNRFIENPQIHNPRLLQTEYIFERAGRKNGFENKKLYRLRYSKEYEVKSENVPAEF